MKNRIGCLPRALLLVAAIHLFASSIGLAPACAQEPIIASLDPVTAAFRAAAFKLVQAPRGTAATPLLRAAVLPALQERAAQDRKRRLAPALAWGRHGSHGQDLASESAAVGDEETALSGEDVPKEIEFTGHK